jgi:hypothetical protein
VTASFVYFEIITVSKTGEGMMARKRMIDPEFWSDDKMCELSRDTRLFYIGLWNISDDQGRFEANVSKLKAQIFPLDNDVDKNLIKEFLQALLIKRRILIYQNGENVYGVVLKFLRHQKINRPTPSRIPAPPKDLAPEDFPNDPALFPKNSVSPQGVVSEDSGRTHAQEKLIEFKRKEKNIKEKKRQFFSKNNKKLPKFNEDTHFLCKACNTPALKINRRYSVTGDEICPKCDKGGEKEAKKLWQGMSAGLRKKQLEIREKCKLPIMSWMREEVPV